MVVIAFYLLFPFLWAVLTSFRKSGDLGLSPFNFIFNAQTTFSNYVTVFTNDGATGPDNRITADFLRTTMADIAQAQVYVCGPTPMMAATSAALPPGTWTQMRWARWP